MHIAVKRSAAASAVNLADPRTQTANLRRGDRRDLSTRSLSALTLRTKVLKNCAFAQDLRTNPDIVFM
jgi:hypothetical protein